MNSVSEAQKLLDSLQKEESAWRVGRWLTFVAGLMLMAIYLSNFVQMFFTTYSNVGLDQQPIIAGFWMFFIGSMTVAWTLGRWHGDKKTKALLKIAQLLSAETGKA